MKKIILSIILFSPIFLYAEDRPKLFNLSGVKTLSSVYTDIKGNAYTLTGKGKNLVLNQSTRFLLEGNTKKGLSAYMNYDDTREVNPLEMLIDYQKNILSASLGHMDIVLDETEFSGYNRRMFGAKTEINTDQFRAQAFGAINRGIPRTVTYQGDIGCEYQYLWEDEFVMRKYYRLLPEGVIDILLDDGIPENGQGLERLTPYTDYCFLRQNLSTSTTTILALTTPAELNAIIQVVYEQSGTITIKRAGISGEEICSYYKLSYPDIVPGSEVISANDLTLKRGLDYQINYTDGSVYFATKTIFSINYNYVAKIYSLDPPVLPGSERVMVNGNQKQRGIDYTVNYETGEVRFSNQHESGIYQDSEVTINYETMEEGGRYNLTGLRGGYTNKNGIMNIGCTYLSQSDTTPKAKTSLSMAQIKHRIVGFNTNIQLGDGLRIIGEVAASRKEPGNHAKIYLDDMEGADLLSRWKALNPGVKLSAEKNPENIAHPEDIDNHQVLRISCGQGTNTIEQIFPEPLDISLYSNMGIWIQTQGFVTVTLCLYSVNTDHFFYDITPIRGGEYQYIKKYLSTRNNINRIQIILNNNGTQTAIVYLDDLMADGSFARDGLAKKVNAVLENEWVILKAGVKDIDYGFNSIGSNNFEPINDTRAYQAEAQIPLINQSTLCLKYENKLKSKSSLEEQIKQDIFSTGIRFEPSDAFNININYKQDNENDSKAIHTIDNINKKTTLSLNINKENILHLSRFGFFNRLMNINSRDNIHNLHTSSNYTNLRFNLSPVPGMEIIPEYKLRQTKDINKQSRVSEEENILGDINITSLKNLSTVLRYSHNRLLNLVLDNQQYNQTLSMDLKFSPKGLPALNMFFENMQERYLEQQGITVQTDASVGNIKISFSSSKKWKWLTQYRFSRNASNGLRNKTDNYTGEITRWFKMQEERGTASLTPRISRNIAGSSIVDKYFIAWETIFKKGLSTRLSYELSEKDTPFYGGWVKNNPSVKIGYTTEKWNISSEIKQTKNKNKVSMLKTIDNRLTMGAVYKIKNKITASESFTWSNNESTRRTIYSSSMGINWKINKMVSTILKSVWSNVHNQVDSRNDYESNSVSMDVSVVF